MSASDPVKALREWAALCENDERADYPVRALKATEKEWRNMLEASSQDDDAETVRIFVTARTLLAAAPALLARLEAGEALLREARIDTPLGDELDGKIDAFLAGKEAPLGAKTEARA